MFVHHPPCSSDSKFSGRFINEKGLRSSQHLHFFIYFNITIYALNKYLLSLYYVPLYVPGTRLSARDTNK